MQLYQYQIIRFRDRITEEFINVGLVIFYPSTNTIRARVITTTERLEGFFPGTNGEYLLSSLEHFQKMINDITPENGCSEIIEITHKILPPNDSALYLSDKKTGVCVDFCKTVEDLYSLIVSKYEI